MIHPTGVLSKYENDSSCRWLKSFLRISYCTRSPRKPASTMKPKTVTAWTIANSP